MESFLGDIKHTADSLAMINSTLTYQELVPYIVDMLDSQYEIFVTVVNLFWEPKGF